MGKKNYKYHTSFTPDLFGKVFDFCLQFKNKLKSQNHNFCNIIKKLLNIKKKNSYIKHNRTFKLYLVPKKILRTEKKV